jgi:hypothetical protein
MGCLHPERAKTKRQSVATVYPGFIAAPGADRIDVAGSAPPILIIVPVLDCGPLGSSAALRR